MGFYYNYYSFYKNNNIMYIILPNFGYELIEIMFYCNMNTYNYNFFIILFIKYLYFKKFIFTLNSLHKLK
jgi:hypothetical protein